MPKGALETMTLLASKATNQAIKKIKIPPTIFLERDSLILLENTAKTGQLTRRVIEP